MALKLKDIVQGTTRRIDLLFTDPTGVPYDLTGGKVSLAVTSDPAPTSDSTAAISVSTTNHTAPTLGQSRIVLAGTDTSIPVGTYNFGAQAVLADGTIIENTGTVKVRQQYKIATS